MTTDQAWRTRALCDGLDPDEIEAKFFPHQNSDGEEAKAICRHCPVARECLTYALETAQEFGVWGAMTEKERFVLRTGKNVPTMHARCGTYSGVSRHRKAGEDLCRPCKEARNAYERDRRAEMAS